MSQTLSKRHYSIKGLRPQRLGENTDSTMRFLPPVRPKQLRAGIPAQPLQGFLWR